jgi:hypothetical protein
MHNDTKDLCPKDWTRIILVEDEKCLLERAACEAERECEDAYDKAFELSLNKL